MRPPPEARAGGGVVDAPASLNRGGGKRTRPDFPAHRRPSPAVAFPPLSVLFRPNRQEFL